MLESLLSTPFLPDDAPRAQTAPSLWSLQLNASITVNSSIYDSILRAAVRSPYPRPLGPHKLPHRASMMMFASLNDDIRPLLSPQIAPEQEMSTKPPAMTPSISKMTLEGVKAAQEAEIARIIQKHQEEIAKLEAQQMASMAPVPTPPAVEEVAAPVAEEVVVPQASEPEAEAEAEVPRVAAPSEETSVVTPTEMVQPTEGENVLVAAPVEPEGDSNAALLQLSKWRSSAEALALAHGTALQAR
jgi:hypothetical protein